MTTPRNVTGVQFFEVRQISVNEWHPEPDGKGLPTQVHLNFTVADIPYDFIMRFKSGRAIDELIVALITHRKAVFGDVPQ